MSILIKGMEMPKDKQIILSIDEKGVVYIYGVYPTTLYQAIELPPHEDLIDKGVLKISLLGEEYGTNFPTVFNQIIKVVNSVPVVVESEE